ncbi:MAG: 6,7-dimethyl-8-ribityllumazine synthase [Bacteroidales bacterium]|nr:6,7-dimethyl-8-ribityllumazine synthase [Bacteroidales bacterium]MBD5258696.1 6,7-dimethyl-8-ribityllumazine synthase [Barnesiella sp.]
MSTSVPQSPLPEAGDIKVAIVKAQWNGHITNALTESALATFAKNGADKDNIDVFEVPGAVELTFAASQLIETSMYDAVIVFGCVVRGGTPHFDYVCQSVTQGITALNADCDTPVIFGVLTVDTEQDALDRCGGKMGDKGAEAAEAAIRMYDFVQRVRNME